MRTTIRRNTFETNSSSTHTLILVSYDVADAWRELGEEFWLDLAQVESEAEASGSGYGDTDWVQAIANKGHLVSKPALEVLGEWNNTRIAYQDDIDANWKLPLDVIENPQRWVDDQWSAIASVKETDDGYVVLID